MPPTIDRLRRISNAEAGRRLGMSTATIRKLIAEGVLKTISLPQGVRHNILESSVDALLAKWQAESQAG